MDHKNKFWLIAAMFVLFGVMTAQAQSAVHPKAYYDAITYQWTDASGAQHTNAITDLATDPYQIVALLKKVYCDPNIPGPWYSAYKADGTTREREVDYGAVGGGWNISADDVTKPYEEGYTILMVSVKEQLNLRNNDNYGSYEFPNANALINYIGDNVASVQLLTDGLRVGEGYHTGTVFNISGTYNRFFMLGKGQARKKSQWVEDEQGDWFNADIYGEMVPFKSMFEQFSPTDGGQGAQILDFYSKMVAGDAYPVVHDCASVLQNEHYFSMAGKNNHDPRSLTGMNIFIPDYRLLYWETYDNNGNHVAGRMMNPYRDLNGRIIRSSHSYFEVDFAQYHPDYAPMVGIYTIKLEGEAAEGEQEKTYDVVLDWTSSLDNMAHGTVPQNYTVYIVTTDENGNETLEELVVTTETTYTYTVPQDEHSYVITYIVYGVPNDGVHDEFVAWSNTADVVIPGWNDFMNLELTRYQSDYESSVENNYYRNYMNLQNLDLVNALTIDRINAGENSFTLYRYDVNNENVLIPVAVLTLEANGNRVQYGVEYDNQELYNGGVTPTTYGYFNAENGVVDLSPIVFIDQFAANTALNDHPVRYGYVLQENNVAEAKSTNAVEVPVFKTSSSLDGFYTKEAVDADINHELMTYVKNANVEMNLSVNPAVYYYTLERGDNVNPNEAISLLQRNTDGSYKEMMDVLGYDGQVYDAGMVDRFDNQILTGIPGDFMTYQPVVWTFGESTGRTDGKDNSYGSPILRTGIADLAVDAHGTFTAGNFVTWFDENNQLCCIYNPIITVEGIMPENASIDYDIYMYRVWRLCDNIRNYTYNPVTGLLVNDKDAERDADKLICELQTNEPIVVFGNEQDDVNFGGLAFGAVKHSDIKFLVRLYYKKSDRAAADAPLYYVVDKTVTWTNMVTGVNEIQTNNEVSRTYYNAQGLASDKPFDGVNIVVTRFSDGRTETAKIIK